MPLDVFFAAIDAALTLSLLSPLDAADAFADATPIYTIFRH